MIESADDKIKRLGLRFEPAISSAVKEAINKTKLNLSEAEAKALEPIMLAKAGEEAILNGRKDILMPDVDRVGALCLIEHLTCLTSTILRNRSVTSAVSEAPDAQSLINMGIDNIHKLSNTPTNYIVDKYVANLKASTPTIDIPASNIEKLSRRVELWKLQAEVLSTLD